MAAYKAIIPQLRANVDDTLLSISLGMFTSNPFRMRAENDRPTQPIAEIAGGTPRIWEMGEYTEKKPVTMGSPEQKWEYVFPLRILYPANDPEWLLAADDDEIKIHSALNTDGYSIAGVDIRETRFDDFPSETEYLEEPNWLVRTIPLWTVIEIS